MIMYIIFDVIIGLVVIFFKKMMLRIVLKIKVIVILGDWLIKFIFFEDKIVIRIL